MDKAARFWGETDPRKLALVEKALTLGAEEKHVKRLLFSGDIRYDENGLRITRSCVRNVAHAIVLALIPVGTLECFYLVVTSPYSTGTKLLLIATGTLVASVYLRVWCTLSVLAWWALKRTGKTLLQADELRANTPPSWLTTASAIQGQITNASP